MNTKSIVLLITAALFSLFACNDASVIGLDLVEDDQINIQSKKDLPFTLTTVLGDPIETYDSDFFSGVTTYLCGELNDPVFGRSKASIYTEFSLNFFRPITEIENLNVDSIVLVLPYDQAAIYGDTTKEVTLEIYEIEERLDNAQDYFSNQTVMLGSMPIGTRSFLPKPGANKQYLDYSRGRIDTSTDNFLRIPLSKEFGQKLLGQDTSIYRSDSTFLQVFNGIHIRATDGNNTMLAFNLLSSNNDLFNGGIYVYYDTLNTGGIPNQYQFPFFPINRFNTVRFDNYDHDYTNTPVDNNLGEKPVNEEVIYVQGMSGVNGKLEFTDLSALQNAVVNQAKLELVLLPGNGEDPIDIFPPAEQLLLFEEGSNGQLELISDFTVASAAVDQPVRLFGGDLKINSQDSTIQSYTILLSNHFQEMIDGKTKNNTIYIQVAPPAQRFFVDKQVSTKGERANRSILGSEQHQEEKFRAKFTLIYTIP